MATIRVDGLEMRGLFDTGCHRVVIDPKAVTKLDAAGKRKKLFRSNLRATLADGSIGRIHGSVWVTIEYRKFSLTCQAVVMDTGSTGPDVLIGNQFMKPAGMTFDWLTMTAAPAVKGSFMQKGSAVRHQFVDLPERSEEEGLLLVDVRHNVLTEVPAVVVAEDVEEFSCKGVHVLTTTSKQGLVTIADAGRGKRLSAEKIWSPAVNEKGETVLSKGMLIADTASSLSEEATSELPVNISPDLTADQRQQALDLVNEFRDIFYMPGDPIGCMKGYEAVLDTGTHQPIRRTYYEQTIKHLTDLRPLIEDLDEKGITTENTGAWGAPVLVVYSHGKPRMVVDYRELNAILADHPCPLPQIKGLFLEFQDTEFWSTGDMAQGYYQIKLAAESQPCTGIVFKWGTRMFTRLPMGVRSGPGIFMEAANKIIGKIPSTAEGLRRVFCYLDDIASCGKSFEEALHFLRLLFVEIRSSGFKLSPKKVFLLYNEIMFLGHRVGRGGIRMNPARVEAIINMKEPNTEAKMRSYIGFVQQVAGFIPFCADLVRPLSQTLRKANQRSDKKIVLGEEQREAMKKITQILTEEGGQVLAIYDRNADFEIRVDASNYAIGALIYQLSAGKERRLLAVYSRQLRDYELHCTTTEKEAMAIAAAFSQFRVHLYGAPGKITVFTDHCGLCWLHKCRDLTSKLCRWSIALSQYKFEIVHVKGINNTDADHLSRYVYDPLEQEAGEEFMTAAVELTSTKKKLVADELTLEERKKLGSNECRLDLKQKEVPLFLKAMQKLEGNRDEWKKFVLKNGLLYHRSYRFGRNRVYHSLCVGNEELREKLVKEAHESAHFGSQKVYDLLSMRFYWPRMLVDILNRCTACHECQMVKEEKQPTAGLFIFRFIPPNVAEIWSIDAMGPFDRSSAGHKFVLVAVCNLSRFTVAAATRDNSADALVKFVDRKLFKVFGNPVAVQSDRGGNFTSDSFKSLLLNHGVVHLQSAPYHSEGSALVERKNADIKNCLQTKTKTVRKWSDELPAIMHDINTTVCSTVKTSPFTLMFLKEPRLAIDQMIPEVQSEAIDGRDFLSLAKEFRATARTLYRKEQEKWSVADNEHRRQVVYEKGDKVALRAGKKTGKLGLKFTGPHEIVSRYGNDYIIRSCGRDRKIKTANVDRLKPYKDYADLKERQMRKAKEVVTSDSSAPAAQRKSKRPIKLTADAAAGIIGTRDRVI